MALYNRVIKRVTEDKEEDTRPRLLSRPFDAASEGIGNAWNALPEPVREGATNTANFIRNVFIDDPGSEWNQAILKKVLTNVEGEEVGLQKFNALNESIARGDHDPIGQVFGAAVEGVSQVPTAVGLPPLDTRATRTGLALYTLGKIPMVPRTSKLYQSRIPVNKRIVNVNAKAIDDIFTMPPADFQAITRLAKQSGINSMTLARRFNEQKGILKTYLQSKGRYGPLEGTKDLKGMAISDYDEADDFYNVIEDDDYLLSRFEGYDNPDDIKSEITTFIQNRERIDASRMQSHQLLQSFQRRGFQIPKQHKGKVRDVAGWIFTPELERIARENDLDIVDVYSYLKTQDVEMYRFKEAVKVLNDLARPAYRDKVLFNIERLEKSGTFAPGTLRDYQELLRKIDNKKISFWSRGHKEALGAIFARGLSGGDRATNIYLQPFLDEYIRNPSGTITKLKNNAGLKDQEDLPLYALVKLADASWNLEDDFLRHANPFSKMIKREGVIDQEYHEIAEFMFRKLTKEGLEEWNMPDVSATIDKAKYPDKVTLYKEAMVDAIVAYIEEFEDLQRRNVHGTDGLPLSSANLYEWFYRGNKSLPDGVQHRLGNVLEAALRKALSDRGLKMDKDGNIK